LSAIVSNVFINHNFSEPIDMHATYFSMYIALGALAMIYGIVKTVDRLSRLLYGFILLVLSLGLVQLSSRSVLIAVAVILILILPWFLFEGKKRVRCLLVSLFACGAVLVAINSMDTLKARFIVDLKQDLTQASVRNNTLEPRIKRWECAWDLIKRSPIYGHGSGSEVVLLKEVYFQKKLYNSYLHDLNAHNQYLGITIKTGAVGLFVWLWMLITGFRMAWRRRNLLFAGFLVIVSVVSFSENILDANKGIFFFGCFFSLFYIAEKSTRATKIL
jgi:O-antigen ligase